MKKLIILLLTVTSFTSYAQRATIENDVANYAGKTYAVNDTISLAYGSKGNKDFAYIQFGGQLTGMNDLEKKWSNYDAVIDKVYFKGKSVYLRAKLLETAVNALGGYKLFIDLTGAVDNKEIK